MHIIFLCHKIFKKVVCHCIFYTVSHFLLNFKCHHLELESELFICKVLNNGMFWTPYPNCWTINCRIQLSVFEAKHNKLGVFKVNQKWVSLGKNTIGCLWGKIHLGVFEAKYTWVSLRQITIHNHNRNCNLETSKMPLKSQAQGTSLFTSADWVSLRQNTIGCLWDKTQLGVFWAKYNWMALRQTTNECLVRQNRIECLWSKIQLSVFEAKRNWVSLRQITIWCLGGAKHNWVSLKQNAFGCLLPWSRTNWMWAF